MYIISNYEHIQQTIRPESFERLNNLNIDPLVLLKKYVSSSKFSNNKDIVKVSYKQNNNVGRYFAAGSLSFQNLPREIRHTLAHEYYYDVDIKNCHAELMCQYAKKHSLPCKYIKKYIDNRELIFK